MSEKVEESFLNKTKFSKLVENEVFEKSIGYMEAILLLCEKNDIDPEDVKKFISPIIKDKLEAEAMGLNFLPQTNTIDSALFE
jgi:hypothetical protein